MAVKEFTPVLFDLGSRFDVDHFNFGKLDTTGFSSFEEYETQSIDVTAHTVKVGLNYRWGAP